MGTRPQTPGIYRFQASRACGGRSYRPPCQPLSRRSGRFPALPYPPLRQNQLTRRTVENKGSLKILLPECQPAGCEKPPPQGGGSCNGL